MLWRVDLHFPVHRRFVLPLCVPNLPNQLWKNLHSFDWTFLLSLPRPSEVIHYLVIHLLDFHQKMRQTLNFTWVSGEVGRWCHLCRGYRAQLVQPNEAQSRGILRAQLHQQNDPRHDYFPVLCHLQRACDGKYNFIKHPAGCLLQILELLLTDVLRIGDHFKKFAFGIKFYHEFINVFEHHRYCLICYTHTWSET